MMGAEFYNKLKLLQVYKSFFFYKIFQIVRELIKQKNKQRLWNLLS